MTSIDGAISSVIAAKDAALKSQIQYTVAGKQLDAMQAEGDAVNALLADAAKLSKSLGSGSNFDAVG